MTFGSLCDGIGGFIQGLVWAGMKPPWLVEIDDRCRALTAANWPHVKQHGDIHDVGKRNLEPVDLICGGIPCQPASRAGKQGGAADMRWLWPEALRIVEDSSPLGCFSRTLLESETWASLEFNLRWMASVIPEEIEETFLLEEDEDHSLKFWERSKKSVTKSRYSVFRLVPSAPRRSGSGISSWPTPTRDGNNERDGLRPSRIETGRTTGYITEVMPSVWPTPNTCDATRGSAETDADKKSRGAHTGKSLIDVATWRSPSAGNEKRGSCPSQQENGHNVNLPDQMIFGLPSSGCLVRTEKFVERLTTLSAWLMGYTAAYLRPWATASSRRSSKRSAGR